MKVKALSRSEREWDPFLSGGAGSGVSRNIHNPDPVLHPFERAREYKRAINAVKLDRIFAKPFLYALEGHVEGIYAVAKSRSNTALVASGSADGQVSLWHLGRRGEVWSTSAHQGFVRGISFLSSDSDGLLTCGDDKTIKYWKAEQSVGDTLEPVRSYSSCGMVTCVDSHWKEPVFASCGEGVDIWNLKRSNPYVHLSWDTETVYHIRFHSVETNWLLGCGSDRGLTLFDIRSEIPVQPYLFTAANEDNNLYTFDLRYMKHALKVHSDHVSAVMSVDYSPTGKEFVSGSYDKTIRIFGSQDKLSREVYHTKRMQRVFAVQYSGDSRFIISGSDDGIVRVWKNEASTPLKPLLRNEKEKLNYEKKLKERYGFIPDKQKAEMKKSKERKERNRRLHSKPGSSPAQLREKEQVIVGQLD
ncbi:DDB1- and CUL4-associated factor 13 [Galdieria sulphuraria]|nr:DDB1- and CUL4-associated factor 13 [Galdieria sulphuraria]